MGWLLCLTIPLSGQQVLNAAGTRSEAGGVTLDYSIGELMIRQAGAEGFRLTEGVIQPLSSMPTSLESPALRQKAEVFPNPAFDYVHIRTPSRQPIEYSLVSGSGKVLGNGKLPGGSGIVSIKRLPAGWYVLYLKSTMVSYDPVKLVVRPVK